MCDSNLDPARPCICHPQVLHLHSSPARRINYAKGSQDIERVGLEHRQTEAKVILNDLLPSKLLF